MLVVLQRPQGGGHFLERAVFLKFLFQTRLQIRGLLFDRQRLCGRLWFGHQQARFHLDHRRQHPQDLCGLFQVDLVLRPGQIRFGDVRQWDLAQIHLALLRQREELVDETRSALEP